MTACKHTAWEVGCGQGYPIGRSISKLTYWVFFLGWIQKVPHLKLLKWVKIYIIWFDCTETFFVWEVCVHLLHHSIVARHLQPSVVTMAQLVESLGTALRWAQALQTFEETGCVSLVHAVSLGESMWRTYYWWKTTEKQIAVCFTVRMTEWPTIYLLLRLVRQYHGFIKEMEGKLHRLKRPWVTDPGPAVVKLQWYLPADRET